MKKNRLSFPWIFSIICILSLIIYPLCFGSVLLFFVGIAALPIKQIHTPLYNRFSNSWIKPLLLGVLFFLAIFILPPQSDPELISDNTETSSFDTQNGEASSIEGETIADDQTEITDDVTLQDNHSPIIEVPSFDSEGIPAYSGEPYCEINDNSPFFSPADYTMDAFERYSDLDELGRSGVAYANVCKELMPTEERGKIGSIRPSGWHTVKYQGIDGNYLYNRCHLIGYQLTGENANMKNLITGTRYLNTKGMLPFELQVADYITVSNNHVLYRATPIYKGNDLVAYGVLLEAHSVEDDGTGINFCVFCYNVQPGIEIDYATGDSAGPEYKGEPSDRELAPEDNNPSSNMAEENNNYKTDGDATPITTESDGAGKDKQISTGITYVCNTNTHKFHKPSCSSIKEMKRKNMKEVTCDRLSLIELGYSPCKRCRP